MNYMFTAFIRASVRVYECLSVLCFTNNVCFRDNLNMFTLHVHTCICLYVCEYACMSICLCVLCTHMRVRCVLACVCV